MAEIKTVTADDLRQMEDQEGLVLQGCGGDLQEWVDGINDLFTEAGILQSGSRFGRVSVFQQDGLTNLLFPFEGVQLDVGKLAIWRLQTHAQFGGTWLSDYVPNRLGGFVQEQRPKWRWWAATGISFLLWVPPPSCFKWQECMTRIGR